MGCVYITVCHIQTTQSLCAKLRWSGVSVWEGGGSSIGGGAHKDTCPIRITCRSTCYFVELLLVKLCRPVPCVR